MRRKNNYGKLKRFNPPLDNKGKPYWVPVVVKNKDFLLGHLTAYRTIGMVYDISLWDSYSPISSDRFNDILADGSRVKDLTQVQLKKKVKELIFKPERDEHIENDEEIYKENLLCIDCPSCGMFYSYKRDENIPDKDISCQICGRVILMYTHEDDRVFDYDGTPGLIEKTVAQVQAEMIDDDEKQ